MAVTPKCIIEPSLLTASSATYYTAPTGTITIIDKMTLVNTSATLFLAVTIYLIPAGVTPAGSHVVLKAFTLSPNETYEVAKIEGHVLNTGDFIQAFAGTTNLVSFRVSGREVVI
jgi:tetrahydromethanopterin S-methyltransferase subunit D